jgi:hypothetical protein
MLVFASQLHPEPPRGGFLTGIAVARRLLIRKPGLRIIMLSSSGNVEAEAWASQKSISFIPKEDGYHALIQTLRRMAMLPGERTPLAFIVHGHDSTALYELKN